MDTRDCRRLDHKTLEELRIRAVNRVEAGESPETVIRSLGFSRPRIYEWLAAYREGGVEALKAKPIPGRPRKLTGPQIRNLYRIVTSKNPLQLKFSFPLWMRAMVREVIRGELGVRLSELSVGRLSRKLGLSPQRPLRRAYQQEAESVERWRKEEFPKIQRRAKACNALIFFGGGSRAQSNCHSGTTWSVKGRTPVVPSTGARFGLNVLSAISPRGELLYMAFDEKLSAELFIEFLKRLLHNADRLIFLIVDPHPVHRAAKVKKLVAQTRGALELYYLPSYSPELNPDEHVWNQIKHHGVGKQIVAGQNHLRRAHYDVYRGCRASFVHFFITHHPAAQQLRRDRLPLFGLVSALCPIFGHLPIIIVIIRDRQLFALITERGIIEPTESAILGLYPEYRWPRCRPIQSHHPAVIHLRIR